MSNRKEEYEDYLRSPKWKAIRGLALELHPYCLMCSSTTDLHGHHRKYPSVLGTEPVEWITVVCGFCHSKHHQKCCTKKAKKAKAQKKSKTKKQRPVKIKSTARRSWCPKCTNKLSVIKKSIADLDKRKKQKYYFSEFDKCKACGFIQFYPQFKVML